MKKKYLRTSKELVAFAYVNEEYAKTGDVAKGLMSLFAPIIHEQSGEIFDPVIFAEAVHEKYDIDMRPIIAKGLIPKLEESGLLLKEEVSAHVANYRCSQGPHIKPSNKEDKVNELLNNFCNFASDALTKKKIRIPDDELKEAFIERLKSIQFLQVLDDQNNFQNIPLTNGSVCAIEEVSLEQLSIALDILIAEFITILSEREQAKFNLLIDIASGALLADVVLTLQNPTTNSNLSNLSVVIDSPILMDILDLNTPEYYKYATDLFDLLKKANVTLVTFKHIVEEVHGSIHAPLINISRGEDAYGPLASRIRSDSKHMAYARLVLDSLHEFIEKLDIAILDDSEYNDGDSMKYCSEETEDALRNCLGPLHKSVERRIRDAASVVGVIKMRKGYRSEASLIDSRVVFVTRNVQVAKRSTDCLILRGDITEDDVPPCILDCQIAGVLWFSLGGGGQKLTRDKLIANCMDALYPRPNLLSTVRQFLENLHPDKVGIFEALMRYKRAQRCLLHKTLGYSELVTQDNVEEILEEIRRSTAEEVELEAQQKIQQIQEKSKKEIENKDKKLLTTRKEKEKLLQDKADLEARHEEIVRSAMERACKSARFVQRMRKALVIILYGLLVSLAAYFSNKIGGLIAAILFGLIAMTGFWVVPDKLLRKWIDKAWQEKFDNELKKNNIKDYGKQFQINKKSCIAKKRE